MPRNERFSLGKSWLEVKLFIPLRSETFSIRFRCEVVVPQNYMAGIPGCGTGRGKLNKESKLARVN